MDETDRNFLTMALVLIPTIPLLILLSITQKRKIQPHSSTQNPQYENKENQTNIRDTNSMSVKLNNKQLK